MVAVRLFVLIWSIKLVMGKLEPFIVGGDYVEAITSFPHVALLNLYVDDSFDEYICGSSILNQWILLTAAHCFDDISGGVVFVGHVQRDIGKIHEVANYKQHKKWNTDRIDLGYDIGLCVLKKSLKLGKRVKRVVLMQYPPKAHSAEVAGWGAIDEIDFNDAIQLKHTVQKLWTNTECRIHLNSLPNRTICGGESHAIKNFASVGDSGSGLLVDNEIIIGLVSYKNKKISRSLVVYTDVTQYYKWIIRESRKLMCTVELK